MTVLVVLERITSRGLTGQPEIDTNASIGCEGGHSLTTDCCLIVRTPRLLIDWSSYTTKCTDWSQLCPISWFTIFHNRVLRFRTRNVALDTLRILPAAALSLPTVHTHTVRQDEAALAELSLPFCPEPVVGCSLAQLRVYVIATLFTNYVSETG